VGATGFEPVTPRL